MKAKIEGNPDFGHVDFGLAPGEVIRTESGAMAIMSAGLNVKVRLMGGLLSSIIRRVFGGESLLVSDYSSPGGEGTLTVSSALPGEVMRRELNGDAIWLQGGSFLACTPKVRIATKFGGIRALFGGEGLFFLRCSGRGHLWVNTYGALVERDVDGELIVDTGHVVGWEPSLAWKVAGAGNLFSTLFSGEGLVLRFQGKGKVWLQTRSVGALVGWLRGYCR